MIKVQHTKLHHANVLDSMHKLVTDAELVLVECSAGESSIVLNNSSLIRFNNKSKFSGTGNTYFKPILISKTEKIEEGDMIYRHFDGCIVQDNVNSDNRKGEKFYKILALPEHFSPEQLQMIVDGKLKDKVLVECELQGPGFDDVVKLNPHITVYPTVEENKIKEIAWKAYKASNTVWNQDDKGLRDEFEEWFEQNVD